MYGSEYQARIECTQVLAYLQEEGPAFQEQMKEDLDWDRNGNVGLRLTELLEDGAIKRVEGSEDTLYDLSDGMLEDFKDEYPVEKVSW